MKKSKANSSSGAACALLAILASLAVLVPVGLRALGANGSTLDVSLSSNWFNAAVGNYNYLGYYNGPANNSMAVGTYNTIDGYPNPTDSFAVGNGTGVSGPDYRRNAFVVLKNGDVIIRKPQGDISMGIYGQ